MKKPYIKKFSKISNIDIWIVDGKYIRNNIDEEFTNCGNHNLFLFIPKNEYWIDKERVPGDEKYYIDSMLVIDGLIVKGMGIKEAIRKSDEVDKRERSKSKLMKKEIKIRKQTKEMIKKIHKELWKKLGNKIEVWIINGELVRGLFFVNFTEGGHDKVYSFIPPNEIWIDDDISPNERRFIFLHELFERNLMSKGMSYNNAHKKASEIEYLCRRNLKQLDRRIKEEAKKIQ